MPGPDVALNRRQWLLTAVESTYGVDQAPNESNSGQAVRLLETLTLDLGQDYIEQIGGLGTLGFSRPIATARPAGITFRTFVQGAGSSYTTLLKPPIGNLLTACGMLETFVTSNAAGSPEYSYAPAGRVQSLQSLTIVANIDGNDTRLVGAMGNVNFIMVGASPAIAEFTFRGQLSTEASTLRGSPVGLPSTSPPRWVGSGSVYMNSFQAVIENLNFNTNNTIMEERASVAFSGSGIYRILVTERAPGGSFDPEVSNTSSFNFLQVWRSTSGSVLKANLGSEIGNKFTITVSQAIPKTLAWQDKEGLAVFGIDYQAYESSGNDDYKLSFS